MVKYIVKKILYGFLVLFGVVTAIFFLFSAKPGDPALMAGGNHATAEVIQNIRKDLGLDLPIFERYALYLNDLSPISIHNKKVRVRVIHSNKVNISGKSTIVYCATKKEVEDITAKIIQDLSHQLVQQHNNSSGGGGVNAITIQQATPLASTFVKPYHAGLSHDDRSDAHTEFLIGKVTVIVATVAFGMVSAYQKSVRMQHYMSYF